jgi:hypothetical protein
MMRTEDITALGRTEISDESGKAFNRRERKERKSRESFFEIFAFFCG